MLCEQRGFFLEIADIIRGLGLTILKGVMETKNEKIWARFAVEVPPLPEFGALLAFCSAPKHSHFHYMDTLLPSQPLVIFYLLILALSTLFNKRFFYILCYRLTET